MATHMEKVKLGPHFPPSTDNTFQVDEESKCEKQDSMYIQVVGNDFLKHNTKRANPNRKCQYMHPIDAAVSLSLSLPFCSLSLSQI